MTAVAFLQRSSVHKTKPMAVIIIMTSAGQKCSANYLPDVSTPLGTLNMDQDWRFSSPTCVLCTFFARKIPCYANSWLIKKSIDKCGSLPRTFFIDRFNRRTENHGTPANSSSHAESIWRLKELTEGVGSLFQYFATRIEKDNFLRRRRLEPCRTLKGWPLKPGRTGGIKKRSGSRSNPPNSTLFTTMRSPRRRRLCKECRPSRSSRPLYGSRRKPFTSLVANRFICSK